jgi:purine-binding chemotaxis protein CheW
VTALHVVFRVAGAEYVIPAADVLHMESYTGATPLPGAPPYVAGLVQVRGRVMPVVDVRARFGVPAQTPTLDSRMVIGRAGDRIVALLVDAAREVIKIDPEAVRAPPRLVTQQASGFVKAVVQMGQRLLMLVDFEKLIGEETTADGR